MNLKIIEFNKIDANKEDETKNKIKNLPENIFKKIYNLKNVQSPEVINIDNKYYLAEIKDEEKKNKPMNDPEVLEALNAQLSFKKKIENNVIDGKSFEENEKANNLKIIEFNKIDAKK